MSNRGELFKDTEGKWRFRVKAANGEIVAESESYSRLIDARHELEQLGVAEEAIEVIEDE